MKKRKTGHLSLTKGQRSLDSFLFKKPIEIHQPEITSIIEKKSTPLEEFLNQNDIEPASTPEEPIPILKDPKVEIFRIVPEPEPECEQVPIKEAPAIIEDEDEEIMEMPKDKKIQQLIQNSPNTYFYRNNAPGEKSRKGNWTEEEKELFFKVMKIHPPEQGKWGLFAMHIPGRVGYQCRNFYHRLLDRNELPQPTEGVEEITEEAIQEPSTPPEPQIPLKIALQTIVTSPPEEEEKKFDLSTGIPSVDHALMNWKGDPTWVTSGPFDWIANDTPIEWITSNEINDPPGSFFQTSALSAEPFHLPNIRPRRNSNLPRERFFYQEEKIIDPWDDLC